VSSAVALAALHLLQPQNSVASLPVDVYLLGDGGMALLAVYLGLALALASAGGGALQLGEPGWLEVGSAALLALGAVAAGTAAVFPPDGTVLPVPPATRSGWLHLGSSWAALPLCLLGALAFTLAVRRIPSCRTHGRWMLPVVVLLIGAVAFLALAAVPRQLLGVGQRIVLALLFLWLLLASGSIRVIRRREPEPAGESTGA
jgi:hypothetical protein